MVGSAMFGGKITPATPRSASQVATAVNHDLQLSQANTRGSNTAHWIRGHLSKRVCNKFVLAPAKKKLDPITGEEIIKVNNDPLCCCGYAKSLHPSDVVSLLDDATREWKVNHDTDTLPTDAFGEMEFVGFSQRVSKFVRVDHLSNADTILDLMNDRWGLERPNLLISVTGGAKNFKMKPRLKEVFRRGLMKAAESTGAWIITGGMNAGVMKHVGEAVRDHIVTHGNKNAVATIGIASWGCVNNKEVLINDQGSWPAEYRAMEAARKTSPLDPNHSHFILVDNGTQHQFGVEIALRARLEAKINRLKTSGGEDAVSIPVVIMVLEGGPNTLQTVKSAIQTGTPAVIVEGSGRAADILAYAYSRSSEEEVEVQDKHGVTRKRVVPIFNDDLWTEVRGRIEEEFGKTDIDRRLQWVKECLQKRDHMTVFRMDGSDTIKDIDLAILQALLKVNKHRSLDQLKLALAWNRIDVAKSEIFQDDVKWERGELNEVMYMAVLDNRHEFVKLFLENGVSLRDFLSIKRLLQLYNELPGNNLAWQMLQRKRDKKNGGFISLEDVGKLIQDLTGDFYRPLYLRDHRYKYLDVRMILDSGYSEDETGGVKATSVPYGMANALSMAAAVGEPSNKEHTVNPFDDPIRELFIWATVTGRREMSMIFWEEAKEGIAAALTAQMILSNLSKNTDDAELVKELTSQAQDHEQLAVGVLSACYAADEKKVELLLVRELPSYGIATSIQLAVEADNKAFIAHAACQALLNNIWMGNLAPDTGLLRIWSCIILPPLIFPLIKYRSDDRLQLNEDSSINKKKSKRKELEKDEDSSSKNSRPRLFRQKSSFRLKEQQQGTAKEDQVSVWKRIAYFYNAPVITFIHNCVAYLAFLALFSVIILTDFNPVIETKEIILIAWVFTLFAEEIRQLLADESSNFGLKLRSYISDVWNILDVITLLLFLTGMVLRFIPDCEDCFEAARIILAINLMTFFFRILHIFSVHKELGPKLVMIGRMMVDLCFFVVILMVFIVAYGLAAQAILYPNSPLEFGLIQDVLRKAYWQMYGELFLEEIEGQTDCTFEPVLWQNNTLPRCPANSWVVPVLLGVYILITNILMLNLLIAMFSFTFNKIQEKTDLHWYFLRYTLVREYYHRPPLAPPLITICHVFLAVRIFFQKCGMCHLTENALRRHFSDSEVKQLVLWENANADEYKRNSTLQEQESLECRVKDTSDRVELINQRVDEMAETNFLMHTANATSQPRLPPVLDNRLLYLEEQMKRTSKALDWMIQAMVEKGNGAKGGAPDLPNVDILREEERNRLATEAELRRQEFKDMLQRQMDLHIKSRTSRYPSSNPKNLISRFNVPDDKVDWNEPWEEYAPENFTDIRILEKPWYADEDILKLPVIQRNIKFNQVDENINRVSFLGEYKVKDGIPLNPKGRSGMEGRGVLGRWGPNHAGDPVVTRWKINDKKEPVLDNGKPVLEFISVQRSDNKEWAIPGGIMEGKISVHQCLKSEFTEEALDQLEGEENKQFLREQLDHLFSSGNTVYEGYADDPRNTDNAWIESKAVNYHDHDGNILNHFHLRAGDSVELVRWQTVSSRQSLYAAHSTILQKVAELHKAAF